MRDNAVERVGAVPAYSSEQPRSRVSIHTRTKTTHKRERECITHSRSLSFYEIISMKKLEKALCFRRHRDIALPAVGVLSLAGRVVAASVFAFAGRVAAFAAIATFAW